MNPTGLTTPGLEGTRWRERHELALRYIREKTNQLLRVMGTLPLRPEELDDQTLLDLDPIGIVADSFAQVLAHLHETNAGLEAARREIDAIFRSVGVGIMVLDAEGRILECNEQQRRQFFAGLEAPLGEPCHRAVCGCDELPPECTLRSVLETGEAVCVDGWQKGDRRFDVVGTPVRDSEGRVTRVVLTYVDLTERLRAERALRESEERYRDLFENATDLIQSVRPDGSFALVNQAWRKTLGYTDEDLEQLKVFDIIDPGCVDTCRVSFQSLLSGESLRDMEVRFRSKQGQTVLLEGSASCSFEDGRPVATRGIFRNVTEKRRIEEELQKAQKLESVGLLAGGIAHDFNNLLTGVLANLSAVLPRTPPSGDDHRRLLEAEKAALRARDLTQQLLTFSRGGQPLRQAFRPAEVARESAALALAGSRSNWTVEAPDHLWNVDGDEGQIAQVLRNLLVNAAQAMPDGGVVSVRCNNVRIDIGSAVPVSPGPYVVLAVTDRGAGMAPETLGRVFEPYFTTKAGGTGLGLAVAYSIVQKHGGHIAVESRPAEGTTFWVYLPAAEVGPEPGPPVPEPVAEGAGKVLLMDDEPFIRELAQDLLSELGYEVAVASDGGEAVEMFRRAQAEGEPFGAVVLDLTVPGGMGGREAMEALRALDARVGAIVSSGYSHDPVMANYRDYGFSGVVAKPYTISALSRVLQEVIRPRA